MSHLNKWVVNRLFVQKDLTTTTYEIPGVSWELSENLFQKFVMYGAFSKIVLDDNETAIIDIVEDTEYKNRVEQARAEREKEEAEEQAASKKYLPGTTASVAAFARMMLPSMLSDIDDTSVLRLSGLFDTWSPGKYNIGDLRNAKDQTWECFQAHDNAIYPDINPDNSVWFTFWKPLHGKSVDTARRWVVPAGSHDIYCAGEYMVWIDGDIYECIINTNFSPTDQPNAWKNVTSTTIV